MKITFIAKDAPQYKANLHCHSTRSDGCLTPEELVQLYKEHGYAVLSITDHEGTYAYNEYTTPDFLMVTGYEAYVRPSEVCAYDPYNEEVHLNLLAKDPENVTFIGRDLNFCKYMPHELAASRPNVVLGPRQYTHEYIQRFIDAANANGYLVSYNHPCWSMQPPAEVLHYDGCYSMEIYNTGSDKINGAEYNIALYDALLRSGKYWYCHGADDNHNKDPLGSRLSDSFGAWTMILADELTYPAVMNALEKGRFYASTGPQITALELNGDRVHLECTPAARIVLHCSMKKCVNLCAPVGQTITQADFTIPADAPHVYFSVHAEDGTQAYTHAFRCQNGQVVAEN